MTKTMISNNGASLTKRCWTLILLLCASSLTDGFAPRSSSSPPASSCSSSSISSRSSSLSYLLAASPRQLVAEGMDLFRQGDIAGSIDRFDASAALSRDGGLYLWQRGISYYYADQFREGSQQFRNDVQVSPLDVEEIVWDTACLLRMDSTFPPPTQLSLPPGKKDRRPIMAIVYSLFRGEATEHDLAEAGHKGGYV